jgi:hypothetical protein
MLARAEDGVAIESADRREEAAPITRGAHASGDANTFLGLLWPTRIPRDGAGLTAAPAGCRESHVLLAVDRGVGRVGSAAGGTGTLGRCAAGHVGTLAVEVGLKSRGAPRD